MRPAVSEVTPWLLHEGLFRLVAHSAPTVRFVLADAFRTIAVRERVLLELLITGASLLPLTEDAPPMAYLPRVWLLVGLLPSQVASGSVWATVKAKGEEVADSQLASASTVAVTS